MLQNTQNLFQGFNTSIDQNHEQQQMENIKIPTRKQRRASTYTKLNDKNKSMDPSKLQKLDSSLYNSFHMFKKCVSSEEIFYGKTSQQQLYQMLFEYLTEIVEQPLKLNRHIKSMMFDNPHEEIKSGQMSPLNLSHKKSSKLSKLDRIFTQCNLTKSVSIEFDRSGLSNGLKNNSALSAKSVERSQVQQEIICSQFASIEEVESQRMEDSLKNIILQDSIEPDYMIELNVPQPKRNANVSIRMMMENYTSDHQMKQCDSSEDKVKDQSDQSVEKLKQLNQSEDKIAENNISIGKIQMSATSFGFDFDKRFGGKDLLQQVSLLYLTAHSKRDNQSQVSLSLAGSYDAAESSLFSQKSFDGVSLSDVVQRIDIPLTKQFLQTLYYEPQPFLVTISLVYLLKYLHHSTHALTYQSAPILLATSLLISYKIYEDQPISGLVEYLVENVLDQKITKEEMIKFERHFLQTINYEVVIGNQQFYKMLAMIKHDD